MAKAKVTLQKIFNAGWKHFVENDDPPAVAGGNCRYVVKKPGQEERRCIIGWALPKSIIESFDENDVQAPISDLLAQSSSEFDLSPVREFTCIDGRWTEIYGAVSPQLAFEEAQDLLHDEMATTRGTWKKQYTRERRREIYEQFAKKYGLRIPRTKKPRD
jgi:hypothetical protein